MASVSVSNHTDGMATKLVKFMECEDCPSDLDGQALINELLICFQENPKTASIITLKIVQMYANIIDQLCNQHEVLH